MSKIRIKEEWDSCEKQRCACSKKENPHFKHGHFKGSCRNCRCTDFQRIDFGCWRLAIGKRPVKLCLDDCTCICHTNIAKIKRDD